jgi:hypothetical protein
VRAAAAAAAADWVVAAEALKWQDPSKAGWQAPPDGRSILNTINLKANRVNSSTVCGRPGTEEQGGPIAEIDSKKTASMTV